MFSGGREVLRTGPAPLTLVSFYESDCQGRSPPLAVSSFAISPTSLATARETSGRKGSFGAVFLRIGHPQPGLRSDVGIRQALGSHGCEPRFYLRLGSREPA
jgi:hypothetical protein